MWLKIARLFPKPVDPRDVQINYLLRQVDDLKAQIQILGYLWNEQFPHTLPNTMTPEHIEAKLRKDLENLG